MSAFKFALGQRVVIVISGEKGTVAARAEYTDDYPHKYWVQYLAADGKATDDWFTGSQLDKLEIASESV